MPEKDSKVFVDSMLSADMNGVSTHGIRMLPSYIQKIDKGDFSFDTPSVIKQFPSFSIIDAKNTIGAVSAAFAANIAVEQAKTNGIHTVFSRNSNTFGPGFYYVEKIADAGMIGFVFSRILKNRLDLLSHVFAFVRRCALLSAYVPLRVPRPWRD